MNSIQTSVAASKKVWFVTGTSQGLGAELVRQILARGDSVAATSRAAAKLAPLFPGDFGGRLLPLSLDLGNAAGISDAVGKTLARFGRIDILVNNAGYGLLGAVEEGSDDDIRKMFEVNVHGLLRVTREILPHLRERRSGQVVNLSSMSGLAGVAGFGLYCASKFAVEGLSEAMAQELAPLGIRVTIVEPGPFRTEFLSGSLGVSERIIEDYAATSGKARAGRAGRIGRQPGDPVKGVEAIIKAVTSANPPLHLVLGAMAMEHANVKLTALKNDMETWKELSLSTGFDS
ncbi:MAG TPA: oxidoreductase [Candidatus Acidoferrales bacterium]|jgi:NAD(P)-dependent dehydrogenase (short-subunit alcohol dehydrogenase family)|nr:oxidoreductase [Candidatus Acidoferrales bacterium]